MKKEKIIDHGTLHDFINYKALIEAQAKEPAFLDKPKVENDMNFKKVSSKLKSKKLTLSYKEKDCTCEKW